MGSLDFAYDDKITLILGLLKMLHNIGNLVIRLGFCGRDFI